MFLILNHAVHYTQCPVPIPESSLHAQASSNILSTTLSRSSEHVRQKDFRRPPNGLVGWEEGTLCVGCTCAVVGFPHWRTWIGGFPQWRTWRFRKRCFLPCAASWRLPPSFTTSRFPLSTARTSDPCASDTSLTKECQTKQLELCHLLLIEQSTFPLHTFPSSRLNNTLFMTISESANQCLDVKMN